MKLDCDYATKHQANVFDWNEEAVAWMRSRPEPVRQLMRRFPPSCLVRADRPLVCPAPGEVAQVVSIFEPSDGCPDGRVSVFDPESAINVRCECDPEWLEVVGYWGDMSPELVGVILGGDL